MMDTSTDTLEDHELRLTLDYETAITCMEVHGN